MNASRAFPRAEALVRTCCASLAIAGAAAAPAAAQLAPPVLRVEADRSAAVARHVVVISIDGLRADAIERAGAETIAGLMREGAWSLRAQTILPSKTLPSHTSMLTGVEPAVHGITWNEDESGRTGPVRVSTVFDVAEGAGLRTAAVFGKAKFRHLVRARTPSIRMAPRGNEVWYADRVTEEAERLMRWRRPDLLFVHIADPDASGHLWGWMSAPYRAAVRRADGAVERLVRAARRAYGDDVVVIVTADHGGSGRDHGEDTHEDRTIPWIVWGRSVTPGEITAPVRTMDTAATALWLLGLRTPPAWAGRPVASAFTGTGFPSAAAASAH